jgi:hypothetical protein
MNNSVQQTNRREAGARMRVLTTGIDDVKRENRMM